MKKTVALYMIVLVLISCNSNNKSNKTIMHASTDTFKLNTKTVDRIQEEKFIDFPIPELNSMFPYYATSGAVENSSSECFYNPTDSGIFVFYTLFDKRKVRNSTYSFDEINIGTLTTHTYRKPSYGWSDSDKDQTFILLKLDGKPIKIGKSIQIGITAENLIKDLGKPTYQSDSTLTFLGKKKSLDNLNSKTKNLNL